MLRPLFLLLALYSLRGAMGVKLNITDCPILYYGVEFENIYLTTRNSNFFMCFNDDFGMSSSIECLIGPAIDSEEYDLSFTDPPRSTVEQEFLNEFPHIDSDYKCHLTVKLNTTKDVIIQIASFESATALKIQSPYAGTFSLNAGTKQIDSIEITSDSDTNYADISGCREEGQAYKTNGDVWSFPENCTRRFCNSSQNIEETSCGDMERCQGDHICVLDPTCTVTGPSIIDFSGRTALIEDRCIYNLIRRSTIPGFMVQGTFEDRRRKDVYFLDSVILYIESTETHFYLEQGSRVRMNSTTLSLTSSAQMFEGVELSKTQAGVTAKRSDSGFTITIFYDDNTAQISLTGPTGHSPPPYVEGLCNDNSHTSSEMYNDSPLNCEMQYNDTGDTSDFCSDASRRCSLLRNESFTACHSQTDPDPYYDACYNTLCSYPLVDSLDCQFMEAYARVCNPRINNTLEDWRPFADCPTPKAFCQGRICSHNEFCAETISGETGCFCRGIFASPYRESNTFGEPMVCEQTSASVTLVGCLLEEQGIDYSDLQLIDENCHGQINEQDHTVTFSYNSTDTCGTLVTTNNSHMIFENTIMIQNNSIINRNDPVYINFSCVYPLPGDQTLGFRIKVNSVVKQITSGAWNYTLTMKAFTDEHLTQPVQPFAEVQLDQRIWVELDTHGLDGGFVSVVIDSCWATDKESPTGSPRHDLILNSCPSQADHTVLISKNGEGTSGYFSFSMFQFTSPNSNPDPADVYLHCKVNLCAKHVQGCVPNCNGGGRRRRSSRSSRSKYVDDGAGFITMIWIR